MYLLTRETFWKVMRTLGVLPEALFGVAGRGVKHVLPPNPREAEQGEVSTQDLFLVTERSILRLSEMWGVSPVPVTELRRFYDSVMVSGSPTLYTFRVANIQSVGVRLVEHVGTAPVALMDADGDGETELFSVDLAQLSPVPDVPEPCPQSEITYILAVPDSFRTDGSYGPEGDWVIADGYESGTPLPSPLVVDPANYVGWEPLPPDGIYLPQVDVYRDQFVPIGEVAGRGWKMGDGCPATLDAVGCRWVEQEFRRHLSHRRMWVRHGIVAYEALARYAIAEMPLDICLRSLGSDVERLRMDSLMPDSRVPISPLGTRAGHTEAWVILSRVL